MQHHSQELHHHYLLYADTSNKKFFYTHAALKGLGVSMVMVFIPAMLLSVNNISLAGIMAFYAVLSLFTIVFNPLGMSMVDKFGSKLGLTLGAMVMLVYLYGLTNFEALWQLLLLLPAIGGLFNSFYWGGYHSELMRIAHETKSGSSMALVNIVNVIAISTAPLLGGMITDYAGAEFMTQVAMGIMILSVIPLFLGSTVHEPHRFSLRKVGKVDSQFFRAAFASFAAFSVGAIIVQVLWPLLIFITLQSYSALGAISAVTAILVVIISHYTGKLIDEDKQESTFKKAIRLQGSVWGLKVLAYLLLFNPVTITIISVFRQLASSITDLTLNHSFYSQADSKGIDTGQAIFIHELAIHSVKVLVYGLAALALYLMPDVQANYYYVFVAVMVLALITTPKLSAIVKNEQTAKV